MQRLKTGVAYHGNRMLSHLMHDMKDIAAANLDIVVHMLSHTDWERHDQVLKEAIAVTESEGLEVWVDNWGIGGSPGDKCHFLAYHPEAHMYYGDGEMHPYQICLNAPSYRQFVKDWIDEVGEIGGKTIIWDEPIIPRKKAEGTEEYLSCCACPTCKALFKERYGREMPVMLDEDVSKFRKDTMTDFFDFATGYAKSHGIKNVILFMPYQLPSICSKVSQNAQSILVNETDVHRICSIESIDSFGTDPYWFGSSNNPYEFVYDATKNCVNLTEQYKRDHNIWIQTYKVPKGREEEIIQACDAAYDGGARTILAWGYRGSESNNYRADCAEKTWACTKEGFRRIKDREFDRILAENRKNYIK